MVTSEDKRQKYETLVPQIESLVLSEPDAIACMANAAATIKDAFGHWWVGFYRVAGDELVLGPYQGPLACTRIAYGRGVCGMAWKIRETVVVPDVEKFPGHIACSSLSRSEIVVPIMRDDTVLGVLDIDSAFLGAFDADDSKYLGMIAEIIASKEW